MKLVKRSAICAKVGVGLGLTYLVSTLSLAQGYPPQRWAITLNPTPTQSCTQQEHTIPYSGTPPKGYGRTVDVETSNTESLIISHSGDMVWIGRCNDSNEPLPAARAYLVVKFYRLGGSSDEDKNREFCENFPFCDDFPPPPVGIYKTGSGDVVIVDLQGTVTRIKNVRRSRRLVDSRKLG